MITFLPYPSFAVSAQVLDRKRCWKQVLEAWQILQTLLGTYERGGWKHHPCTKMWRGYEAALAVYYNVFLEESVLTHHINVVKMLPVELKNEVVTLPSWLGDERLHASHRSNLIRKNEDFYGQFGWTEHNKMPYYWPASL